MLQKVKHKGLALAVLAAAQFIVVLDATIVNVALPAIRDSLGFSSDAQLQWAVTAYALLFGGFLLLGGRLADLFGRRRMFLAGVFVFALASLLAGISQNPSQLIVFRALQGLGGAMLAPASLSLMLSIFKEGPERNRALGIWSMVAAGGGAVGLMLGGFLTQYVDWRWIFFINVPLAAMIIASALKYLPEAKPTERQRVDVLGAFLVTGGVVSLVYGLVMAEGGWGHSETIIPLIIAAVLLAGFVINERLVKQPLVRLGILLRRNVTGGVLVMLFMPAAMFGMFFYMSIYLQQILGFSPTMTGIANLPFTLTIIAVASTLSRHVAKISAKAVLVIAPLLVATGLLFLARIPVDANYWTDILPGFIMLAAGMSSVFVVGTMVTTSGVDPKESGLVSGLLNTGQQVGGAVGLAVLTVVSTTATKTFLTQNQGNPALLQEAIVHGFHQGFKVAALFAVAASIIALVVLKVRKPSKSDLAHEAENEAEALSAIPGV